MHHSLSIQFKLLRYLAAAILICITFFIISLSIRIHQTNQNHMDVTLRDAHVDFSVYELYKSQEDITPLPLSGMWEYFPNVYFEDSDSYDKLLLTAHEYVSLPISTLTEASNKASYRLYLKPPNSSPRETPVIFIPNLQKDIRVFFNGSKLNPVPSTLGWRNSSQSSPLFFIPAPDDTLEYQEIVISVKGNASETPLYGRTVLFGTERTINTYIFTSTVDEMFLLGAMILILVNGFIFMLIRPNHTLISLITLFDTALILRIFFGMKWVTSLLRNLFPEFYISDTLGVSASVFFLMLAGIIGVKLSSLLFDPNGKVPQLITRANSLCYFFMAIIFPIFPNLFEAYGIYILRLVYIVTCLTLLMQFIVCWRERISLYYGLQMIKTAYIGVIILLDILGFTKNIPFILFIYGYGLFFIIHIFMRLYDNNNSYNAAELSIRDPLTQAYNRLYFEQYMEEKLGDPYSSTPNVYLSILDLDFFKNINDSYGHVTGDEQLKKLVTLIHTIIDEDVLLARIGGEEFVLFFCHKTQGAVVDILNKIRVKLEYEANANPKYTTASIGVTDYRKGDTIKTLMMRADKHLYEAKRNGRNQVVTGFLGD